MRGVGGCSGSASVAYCGPARRVARWREPVDRHARVGPRVGDPGRRHRDRSRPRRGKGRGGHASRADRPGDGGRIPAWRRSEPLCVQAARGADCGGPDTGAWPAGTDARPRPGFAHGAAGIALALARWAARRPDRALTDAVAAAWAYERRMFCDYGRDVADRARRRRAHDDDRLVPRSAWHRAGARLHTGRPLPTPRSPTRSRRRWRRRSRRR